MVKLTYLLKHLWKKNSIVFRRLWTVIFFLWNINFSHSVYAQDVTLKTLSAYHIGLLNLGETSPRLMSMMNDLYTELLLLSEHQVDAPTLFWLGYQAKLEELESKQSLLDRNKKRLESLKKSKYPNLKTISNLKRNIKQQEEAVISFITAFPKYRIASILPIVIDKRNELALKDIDLNEIGMNFWIFGEWVEISDKSAFLHLKGYDVQEQREYTLYRGTMFWDDRKDILRKSLDVVRHRLLGRSWSAIEVKDIPETSSFRLQWQDVHGVPRTPAEERVRLENLFVESGKLRAHAVGFQRQEWYLDLLENNRYEVVFNPIESQEDDRYVSTNIVGADVYLDGLYIGQAPVTIKARSGQIISIIDSSNKRPHLTYKVKEVDEDIFLQFALPLAEQQILLKRQKKHFYIWAGSFVTSLILPIVFYNMHLDYHQKYERFSVLNMTYEQNNAQRMSSIYGYAGLGTALLSAGLLGATIYELYRYVEVSKGKSRSINEEYLNKDYVEN